MTNINSSIKEWILYNYKIKLTDTEVEKFIDWYIDNIYEKVDEDKIDGEIRFYLYSKYTSPEIILNEQDLSHIKYLLALAKTKTGR